MRYSSLTRHWSNTKLKMFWRITIFIPQEQAAQRQCGFCLVLSMKIPITPSADLVLFSWSILYFQVDLTLRPQEMCHESTEFPLQLIFLLDSYSAVLDLPAFPNKWKRTRRRRKNNKTKQSTPICWESFIMKYYSVCNNG